MKENISIRKNIYNSNKYREVIDTNFSELYSARQTFTVEDFFDLYNELFLEIPETGDLSHAALIQKSNQLITPGKDAKDKEIENLQSTIEDLQKQLIEANKPTTETTTIKEHPRFANGTFLRRQPNGGWPWLFVMDQGFKRAVTFTESDPELRTALIKLAKYTGDNGQGDNPVPIIPNKIIDDIPSGDPLTLENFNDIWTPSEYLSESEELRIELDPTDANLNPDNYNGDYVRYRNELEKDVWEKTKYIESLDDKMNEIRKEIENLTAG